MNLKKTQSHANIIAPLDNLLWDRKMLEELFDFYYRWEVYKPVELRQYGYYVLPVLYGDKFVARFEPGKDKDNGNIIIKNWWWEPGVKQSKTMETALNRCFKKFLNFLGYDGIKMDKKKIKKAGLEWIQNI